MLPFLEKTPVQWVTNLIAAQGIAAGYIKERSETGSKKDAEMLVLSKGILYAGWMMYKAGLLSIEDQTEISSVSIANSYDNIPEFMRESLLDLIPKMLSSVYNAIDEVYEEEIERKMLISDLIDKKATLQ